MISRGSGSSSTSSTVSVAIGVVLGAVLTFAIQLYGNRVEDQRNARKTRAQHIERLMIATSNCDAATVKLMLKVGDVAARTRDGGIASASLESLTPDLAPVTELHAVTTLYLPEVQPEADRVAVTYMNVCSEMARTYSSKLLNYKSGDPAPKPDHELEAAFRKASAALEKKLIDLAKKNSAIAW
jgi:hypothetical protein